MPLDRENNGRHNPTGGTHHLRTDSRTFGPEPLTSTKGLVFGKDRHSTWLELYRNGLQGQQGKRLQPFGQADARFLGGQAWHLRGLLHNRSLVPT